MILSFSLSYDKTMWFAGSHLIRNTQASHLCTTFHLWQNIFHCSSQCMVKCLFATAVIPAIFTRTTSKIYSTDIVKQVHSCHLSALHNLCRWLFWQCQTVPLDAVTTHTALQYWPCYYHLSSAIHFNNGLHKCDITTAVSAKNYFLKILLNGWIYLHGVLDS